MKNTYQLPISLLIACLLTPGLTACGDDIVTGPEPHIIQINSNDVLAAAVTSLRIVLEPGALGQSFEMTTDMTGFGGEVTTQVSAAGEVFIDVQGTYVAREMMEASNPNILWIVEVPVRTASTDNDPAIQDPILRVQFNRGTELIAQAQRSLEWPPPPGERTVVTVVCNPGTAAQCQNMAGMVGPDAGAP